MSKTKLSIIIPVYNGEKYIKSLLDSIFIKGIDGIEVIVVNDGSTDNTKEICSQFEDVKLYNISNHGVSYARNYALKNSKGEYVMFVDADDILRDNWFKIISNYFDGTYDIVYFNNMLDNKIEKNNLIYHILNINLPCIGAPFSKIIKRELIQNNNISFPNDIISGEDMIFNLRCITFASNYFVDNRSFYLYRIYNGSSTKRFNPKVFETNAAFKKALIKELERMDYITQDDREAIILFNQSRSITFIANRISFVKPYKEAKKLYKELDKEKYRIMIDDELHNKYITKIKKIVVWLCKIRFYYMVYLMYRTRIIINTYLRKKEKIIEI